MFGSTQAESLAWTGPDCRNQQKSIDSTQVKWMIRWSAKP